MAFPLPMKHYDPNKPRRALNKHNEDWAPFRKQIEQYQNAKLPRPAIIKLLEYNHGFVVTLPQLNKQLSIWKLKTNYRTPEPTPGSLIEIPEEHDSHLSPFYNPDLAVDPAHPTLHTIAPTSEDQDSTQAAGRNDSYQTRKPSPEYSPSSIAGPTDYASVSDLSFEASIFSKDDTASTNTSSSPKSSLWRHASANLSASSLPREPLAWSAGHSIEESFDILSRLINENDQIESRSWVYELWQNALPSPELLSLSFLDHMTFAADCLSAGELRRSAFELYGLCFRSSYLLHGRRLLSLRGIPISGSSVEKDVGEPSPHSYATCISELQRLLRSAIGSARNVTGESEACYAIKLLEASISLLDMAPFAKPELPRAILRLYQLHLVSKFPAGRTHTSRERDADLFKPLSSRFSNVRQDLLATIHPSIRHREYLFLASQTCSGAFGRRALLVELLAGFPIINKKVLAFPSCDSVRAKAHDFLVWCSQTISQNRKVLDEACPIMWPAPNQDKQRQKHLEEYVRQALFWLLVKEQERAVRTTPSALSFDQILLSGRDYFDGFDLNTIDAFSVMVKLIFKGSTCEQSIDRTDALMLPETLLIPDHLSAYCLRKVQLMGVSTFAGDYLEHIKASVQAPDLALSDFATNLGAKFFRSMISDTPFPQALSIANEQTGDPTSAEVLEALKNMGSESQKVGWRQKLAARFVPLTENVSRGGDETLAASALSERSSEMSLDRRSFFGYAYKVNRGTGSQSSMQAGGYSRWTSNFRMSLSSRGRNSQTSGAMSLDSRNSFTRTTGLPHAPPVQPAFQDIVGGWEAISGADEKWI